MKNIFFAVMSILLLVSCSTNKQSGLKKGSPEYSFFETMADSLGYSFLSPESNEVLISTDVFSVKTGDVLPLIYQAFGGQLARASQIDSMQAKQLLQNFAVSDAEKKLILWEAGKSNIKISDDSLEQNMKNIFPNYNNKEAFEKQLAAYHITIERLKKDVRDQMIIDSFLNKNVFTSDAVTDNEIEDYYKIDKTASVRHILFLTRGKSEEEKARIKNTAQKVLKMAKSGINFESLVKKYSEDPGSKQNGGLYKDFKRGEMVKPFEDAAFNLPVGSISDLVETQFGYHIIKIVDRKKETRPLAEAKADIKRELLDKKKRDLFLNYIDSLKKKHNFTKHFAKLT